MKACEDYGFFKVVNHGIQQGLIDAIEFEAKKLFAFPLFEKEIVFIINIIIMFLLQHIIPLPWEYHKIV